jgi:putative sugar O-methyltransferase
MLSKSSFEKLARRSIDYVQRQIRNATTVPYTDDGNRSKQIIDYGFYIKNMEILQYLTEFRTNSLLTGHLRGVTDEEAKFLSRVMGSLRLMQDRTPPEFTVGRMWHEFDNKMLSRILESDTRAFNHIGAHSYKDFRKIKDTVEAAIREVVRTLCLYQYLVAKESDFSALFTNLNSGFFSVDGKKLNSKIMHYEEWQIIRPLLDRLRTDKPDQQIKIVEIGAGEGQLARILFSKIEREPIKYVIVDLPSMHMRSAYFLFTNGVTNICTYKEFLELGGSLEAAFEHFDVVFLPPWEKSKLLDIEVDLYINMRSLSEMSVGEAREYLDVIQSNGRSFFSINTNKASYNPDKQNDIYPELSFLELSDGLKLNVTETGATFADALFMKNIHHVYTIFERSGV